VGLHVDHPFHFKNDGLTHTVFRDGSGSGVRVMHEAPGMNDGCLALADRLIIAFFSAILWQTRDGPTNRSAQRLPSSAFTELDSLSTSANPARPRLRLKLYRCPIISYTFRQRWGQRS
jgi:hypothetical protein